MKNILPFENYSLNENLNNLSFTTPLINSMDEYFLEKSEFAVRNNLPIDSHTNYDISESEFTVNWELDYDARSWGIKDLAIIIKKIHGTFTVNIWGENEDTPHYVEFKPEDWGFEVKSTLEIKGDIIPSNIEINFKDKTVIVS